MQEVLEGLRLGPITQLFADEVLDRFDVVVGRRLDSLNPFCIIERELVDDVVEDVLHDRRERPQLPDIAVVGETLQPAHLDQHTVANQAVLGKDVAKAVDLVGVTAVGGREGSQCRDFHGPESSY